RVVEAELRGDFAQALAEYETLPERDELALGHCSTLALLTGDCDSAIRYLDELLERFGQPLAVAQSAAAKWDAGDPTAVFADPQYLSPRLDNVRDAVRGIFVRSMIEANCGAVPDAGRVEELAWARSREQTFVALVFAAQDLLTSDEAYAAEQFERRLDEIGFDEPLLRGELRRYLPYAYVLSERCRAWLDTDDRLGPVQLELRDLARALLDLRSGEVAPSTPLPANEAILTRLPLPWSIELAARLAGSGDPRGVDLARYLSEVAGASVHDALRTLRSREPGLRWGVDALLAAVPAPPQHPAAVTVCTSFRLAHGGDELVVSRARVRQMITLLALRTDWSRETLADVMWPSDPTKARSNFRATLRHVRQALEPNRVSGEADYHLIQQGERIRLRRSDALEVDLWSVQACLADADVADAAGDAPPATLSRVAALQRWGPDAFGDVRDLDAVAPEIERLRRDVLDAGCAAAERTMAHGDLPGALKIAERVLDLDAHTDRAHGVAIGVQLALGDLGAAERAIERVRASMEDLDLSTSAGIE
ncbi:MAG: bacterial transcriptional activator domain-containing protein, partial [Ilumatobacter sp.]